MAKAKLKTAKDNEYDTKPDKRGNRRPRKRDREEPQAPRANGGKPQA
jgi:hypothetical protein